LEGLAVEDDGVFLHLVYFTAIWYNLFGILFPVLVCCTKKNLATLFEMEVFGSRQGIITSV
jgi:hypothetical protein